MMALDNNNAVCSHPNLQPRTQSFLFLCIHVPVMTAPIPHKTEVQVSDIQCVIDNWLFCSVHMLYDLGNQPEILFLGTFFLLSKIPKALKFLT